MTLNDLIAQLTNIAKEKSWSSEIRPTSQVKIGKEINNPDSFYDYFDIVKRGDCIVFMPSDKWDRKR